MSHNPHQKKSVNIGKRSNENSVYYVSILCPY